ncbi:hypothetical protein ACPVPU_08955 [Sphingomonas sp. CJ99]
MVALFASLLIAGGLLLAVAGIVLALEARGALWLDLIVRGPRPFADDERPVAHGIARQAVPVRRMGRPGRSATA